MPTKKPSHADPLFVELGPDAALVLRSALEKGGFLRGVTAEMIARTVGMSVARAALAIERLESKHFQPRVRALLVAAQDGAISEIGRLLESEA